LFTLSIEHIAPQVERNIGEALANYAHSGHINSKEQKIKMKFLISTKYLILLPFVVAASVMSVITLSPSAVSAAASKADCSNTNKVAKSDKADCITEFDKCGKSGSADAQDKCRDRVIHKYLLDSAREGRDKCTASTDVSACETAYDKCNSKSPDAADACRNAAIAKYSKTTSSATEKLSINDGINTPGSGDTCGNGKNAIKIKFNLGCLGNDYSKGEIGAIQDMLFAFLRFMSVGVGVVVVVSIIVAGIRYSTSQGNPEVTAAAKDRIQSTIIALLIYVFIFSVLQFLVPGGIFQPGFWLPPDSTQLFRGVL
jgi:hypothetical protein